MKFFIPERNDGLSEMIGQHLKKFGHEIFIAERSFRNDYYDPVFRKYFMENTERQNVDAVFSFGFFPILSNLCEKNRMPYISWGFPDEKAPLLLTDSVFHSCNFIFHTDMKLVKRVSRAGMRNIFYLPWAVEIDSEWEGQREEKEYPDISVHTWSDESSELLYLQLYKSVSPHIRGFLDGLLDAQRKIYGFNFLENVLTDVVLKELNEVSVLPEIRGSFASLEERYAYDILYPGVTRKEREKVLKLLKGEFSDYTADVTEQRQQMDKWGRIHLFLASRMVQDAIPNMAFDIMGKGGFLLTNFQNDYMNYFVPGQDFVYFESEKDMEDKLNYYLKHDLERKKIAENALRKVQREHTFDMRIQEILQVVFR